MRAKGGKGPYSYPHGHTPRPLKVGEALRAAAAKRTLQDCEHRLRPKLLEMRQWGVAIPGGAEALCH